VSRKGLGLLVVILALVLALGGCGGDDDGSGASAESWANSVCGDLSEWITDIDAAVKSVTDEGLGINQDTLRDAVDQAKDATDKVADDLDQVGAPDLDAGEQAKEELDTLRSELREQADAVERALDENGAPLEVATTVAAALSAAANQLKESFQMLQDVDPSGELRDAFANSDDCDTLREQIQDIGS
jgi:DNA-binding FrmR family transcriptional regulator